MLVEETPPLWNGTEVVDHRTEIAMSTTAFAHWYSTVLQGALMRWRWLQSTEARLVARRDAVALFFPLRRAWRWWWHRLRECAAAHVAQEVVAQHSTERCLRGAMRRLRRAASAVRRLREADAHAARALIIRTLVRLYSLLAAEAKAEEQRRRL